MYKFEVRNHYMCFWMMHYHIPKTVERAAIKYMCSSNDTFVFFSTCYGKSICYLVIQLCEICKKERWSLKLLHGVVCFHLISVMVEKVCKWISATFYQYINCILRIAVLGHNFWCVWVKCVPRFTCSLLSLPARASARAWGRGNCGGIL